MIDYIRHMHTPVMQIRSAVICSIYNAETQQLSLPNPPKSTIWINGSRVVMQDASLDDRRSSLSKDAIRCSPANATQSQRTDKDPPLGPVGSIPIHHLDRVRLCSGYSLKSLTSEFAGGGGCDDGGFSSISRRCCPSSSAPFRPTY